MANNKMIGTGLQGQYAGFVSRAIAFIGDILVVVVALVVVNAAIALPLQFFFGVDLTNCPPLRSGLPFDPSKLLCYGANWLQAILSIVMAPAYFALFWSLGGQTPVQYAMGLRVVRLDGKRMDFGRSLLRWIGYFVSFFALALGYLWVLWDDRRQGFHDKLARTVVIYSWEARQDEFLLDRLRSRFRRRKKATQQPLSADPQAVAAQMRDLELVLTTFPTYAGLESALGALQEAISDGRLSIINSVSMVKDENGELGFMGVSDLAPGDDSLNAAIATDIARQLRTLPPGELAAEAPNGSFILMIAADDRQSHKLVKFLTNAHLPVKLFDLDKLVAPTQNDNVQQKSSLARV